VALRAEVADLREKLRKSSNNSSKPPSSDGPGTPRTKKLNRRKQTGKKRGAQPGHPKHERVLLPVEQVDVIRDVKPTLCEACGRHLCGEDPNPLRHQVTELPIVSHGGDSAAHLTLRLRTPNHRGAPGRDSPGRLRTWRRGDGSGADWGLSSQQAADGGPTQ